MDGEVRRVCTVGARKREFDGTVGFAIRVRVLRSKSRFSPSTIVLDRYLCTNELLQKATFTEADQFILCTFLGKWYQAIPHPKKNTDVQRMRSFRLLK